MSFFYLVPGSTLEQFGLAGTNYIGPGYTAGQLGGEVDYSNLPEPTNAVDAVARDHDIAYYNAESSLTPNQDILRADVQFLHDVGGLFHEGNLSPWEAGLAKLTWAAIALKTLLEIPQTIQEAVNGLENIGIAGSQWEGEAGIV